MSKSCRNHVSTYARGGRGAPSGSFWSSSYDRFCFLCYDLCPICVRWQFFPTGNYLICGTHPVPLTYGSCHVYAQEHSICLVLSLSMFPVLPLSLFSVLSRRCPLSRSHLCSLSMPLSHVLSCPLSCWLGTHLRRTYSQTAITEVPPLPTFV